MSIWGQTDTFVQLRIFYLTGAGVAAGAGAAGAGAAAGAFAGAVGVADSAFS